MSVPLLVLLAAGELQVDADFAGGNIIVEAIDGDEVLVRQDLRDTAGDWFYWCVRLRGAAGRTVRVRFAGSDVIGTRGPAVSYDGGATWDWLGREAVDGRSFRLTVPEGVDEVRLGMTIPYVAADLERVLAGHANHPALRREVLCRSRDGREVPLLRVGCLDREPRYRLLVTARHHCCETMASFALEGLLAAMLADDELGAWCRERVAAWVVPFVDSDGVEAGDQGKNRRPRDHNRDYEGESLYAETAALREQAPGWAGPGFDVALDLHCPYIRGPWNEQIYLVGSPLPEMASRQRRFAARLAELQRGPLPFAPGDFLAFGEAWNTADNFGAGTSFCRWAAGLPGTRLATTIEIPYATVREATVTPESARAFGRDLAAAIRGWLGD